MATFLERTDKQLDKWTKEHAKEEQGVSSSRTIIIIFFVLQIKKQMAVSCSGRSLARGGSTRQFPPPYPPTTTQPFSRFIYRIFVWSMNFTYVLIFHKFPNSFPFWTPQPTTSRSAARGKSRNLSFFNHFDAQTFTFHSQRFSKLDFVLGFCVIRNFRVVPDKKNIFSLYHWHIWEGLQFRFTTLTG